jgi:hypothetical protein
MKIPAEAELVALTDELHRRLHVQARNLLIDYRLPTVDGKKARRPVPYEEVERLMRLYGNLIARDIFESLKEELQREAEAAHPRHITIDRKTERVTVKNKNGQVLMQSSPDCLLIRGPGGLK